MNAKVLKIKKIGVKIFFALFLNSLLCLAIASSFVFFSLDSVLKGKIFDVSKTPLFLVILLCILLCVLLTKWLVDMLLFQEQSARFPIQVRGLKKAQMLTLTQNMRDGLMLLNKNGRILLSNTPIHKLFGEWEYIHKFVDSGFCQMILQDLSSLKKSKTHPSQIHTIKILGKEHEVQVIPIYSQNKFKGLIVIVRDISAQYLAQKMRKEFSANVTHELKTPLTTILASSEMLQNNLIAPQDVPEFAAKIQKEATRLINMTDEILKLSFLDENKESSKESRHNFQRLDLKEVILNVIDNVHLLAKQYTITLHTNLKSCFILGNAALLEEMVYNLIANAIKYNKPKGSVQIELKAKNLLRIKDNGIGIPKDSQERVFERFYCVDKSRSKALGGTGLGLSIVKSIANLHNAQITLKSTPHKGTEFTISFPFV